MQTLSTSSDKLTLENSKRRSLGEYLHAATRDNTRRSYQSAIEHYEVTWGGFLPATANQIAQYLVDFAESLAVSTLKQRLAALAAWHNEQGFPDPTKAPLVKKTLRGIRELHPSIPVQAQPLQINQLRNLVAWMDSQINQAERLGHSQQQLLWSRNKAILLIGFWRGFRSDELCRMTFEHTTAVAGQGLSIFLQRSKQDRESLGLTFQTPALVELCPVEAFLQWRALVALDSGPVFQSINRWGQLSGRSLNPNSLIGMLRNWLSQSGVKDVEGFSSHSLRRGFASWANSQSWDIKALMEYVGWKDMKSAMRYIESQASFQNAVQILHSPNHAAQAQNAQVEERADSEARTLNVYLRLERYHKGIRPKKKAIAAIERFCLQAHQVVHIQNQKHQYTIQAPVMDEEGFDEWIADLIHEIHHQAMTHQCVLELTFQDPVTKACWE